MIKFNILSEEEYKEFRLNLITQVEENEGLQIKPYIDTKGNPTIGLGMNLRSQNTFDEVMKTFKISDIGSDKKYYQSLNQAMLIKILSPLLITILFFFSNSSLLHASNLHGFCEVGPCCSYDATEECVANDKKFLIGKTKIISGSKDFCYRLMNSHWSYLPLDLEHSITRKESQEYLDLGDGSTTIYEKAGYFDINNDGEKEYIGWIQLHSGAGQGCDMEIFVELNEEKSHIKNSKLSDILKMYNSQGLPSCREYNRAFEFEGKTYIENRRTFEVENLDFMFPSTLSQVYIINENSRNTVCEFKTTPN